MLTAAIESLLLIMCGAGSDCSHYVILTLSSSCFIDEETGGQGAKSAAHLQSVRVKPPPPAQATSPRSFNQRVQLWPSSPANTGEGI